jgi:hypothetical protein
MIRTAPPQAGQVSMSMLNTRFRRCAQVIEARRSAGVWTSSSSGDCAFVPLPRLEAVTRARYLLLGVFLRITRS